MMLVFRLDAYLRRESSTLEIRSNVVIWDNLHNESLRQVNAVVCRTLVEPGVTPG